MKYKIIFLIATLWYSTDLFSQNKIYWSLEYKADAEMFTKFLDTVLTFNSDVKKIINQKKKHFFIEKSFRRYKYGMFSYHRFDFRPIGALTPNLDGEFSVAPRLNGYFEIVFFKKKPIIIIGQYALTNILNPESRDSTVYKLLNRNIQCKKCFLRPIGLPFYYYFKELGSAEKQFITGIVGESLTHLILQDYCNNSTQLEVFKNKRFLEDYDQFVKPPGFYDPSTQPHLKNISKIFSEKMSDNFFKLIYSKSPIFNWFLAEFFNYKESKNKFLNLQEKEVIYNYNGRMGFNKFRSNEELSKIYQ